MSKEVNYNDNVYELEASRFFVDDQTGENQLMSVDFQKCNTKKGIQHKAILRVRCDDGFIRRTDLWPHAYASKEDLDLLSEKPVKDVLIAFGEYPHLDDDGNQLYVKIDSKTGKRILKDGEPVLCEKDAPNSEEWIDYGKKWTMWFDGESWRSFSGGTIPFEEGEDADEENNEDN